MSTTIECKDVLDNLEDDFRQDLAVHLYSAVLLHRIDPLFPPPGWSSWPMPLELVPKPQTTFKYMDAVVGNAEFETDIDEDYEKVKAARYASGRYYIDNYIHFRQDGRAANSKGKEQTGTVKIHDISDANMPSGSELSEHENDEHEEEGDDGYDKNGVTNFPIQLDNLKLHNVSDDKILELLTREGDGTTFKQIQRITFKQKETNSKSDLINEIYALIEKKITEKARKIEASGIIMGETEISAEMPTEVTMQMSKLVARKVDGLLNALLNKFRNLDRHPEFKKKLLWPHLLLAGLTAMESPYATYTPEPFLKLYEKCERLFDLIDYKYEYDGDVGETATEDAEESEEDESSEESKITAEADISVEEVEEGVEVISVKGSETESESESDSASVDASQYESARESLERESGTDKVSANEDDSDSDKENGTEKKNESEGEGEGEGDEGESASESESESESEGESETGSQSESDTEPQKTSDLNQFRKGFDVVRYLHGLQNRTFNYNQLQKSYLQRRAFERRRNHDLKLIYMNRLRIQKSYINLHYYSDEKLAHKQVHSNIDYDNIDLSKLRATALFHGQMSLDAHHYYLDDYGK